jgi:hypothetical protein
MATRNWILDSVILSTRGGSMKTNFTISILIVLISAAVVRGQEPPNFPPPVKEHEWLKQFAGEWETESKSEALPGQPAMECKGTMSSRMLGAYWAISEYKTDIAGTQVHGVQTIGYDPESKKYVGTWVDSMMNHMWRYKGEVDSSGKTLTLEAEGPDFLTSGKTALFRDAYEFKSDDHIVATSSMQGEDGKWVTFITGNMRRKK